MSLPGAALVCILAFVLSGCGATSGPPVAPASSAPPTAARTATPTVAPEEPPVRPEAVTKVLVFIEENHSMSQMRAGMPYTFRLARRFGYATNYRAIRHPSLPNYIAIAGGQTYGITNDGRPSVNPVRGRSVFGQAVASGKTAVAFADGMPRNCATVNGGSGYAVKHNPWAYFTDERDLCQKYDVPADRLEAAISEGSLPNIGMVVPNLCHDAHDCPLGTADAWFEGWMTKIFDGPDWKAGHLAVVLTADEDDGSGTNGVLTVVIHPSQRVHVVSSPLTHYSLTRLYSEVAGMPYLYEAASAPSIATAFGLPLK